MNTYIFIWIDTFYKAVLFLTIINVDVEPITIGKKIFLIIYALVSVVLISLANMAIQRPFDIFPIID